MLKGGKRSQRRGFLKEIPYFKITPDEIILDMMSTSAFFRACRHILCSQLRLMTCEYALINIKVHINLAFFRTRSHYIDNIYSTNEIEDMWTLVTFSWYSLNIFHQLYMFQLSK